MNQQQCQAMCDMLNEMETVKRPMCDNCGRPAVMVGTYPEAGRCYVCDDCWRGQGFKDLKPWDHWRKPQAQPPDTGPTPCVSSVSNKDVCVSNSAGNAQQAQPPVERPRGESEGRGGHDLGNDCVLQRHKDGRLEILSAPPIFICARESIEDLIARHNQLIIDLSEAIDQRDRLAEALRMLRNASLKYKMDEADLEIEEANEALAAVKGGQS